MLNNKIQQIISYFNSQQNTFDNILFLSFIAPIQKERKRMAENFYFSKKIKNVEKKLFFKT